MWLHRVLGTHTVAAARTATQPPHSVQSARTPGPDFWTAEAEAVAPTSVCALFSGIMVELGAHAVARIYWTVYSPVLPPSALHGPLLGFGVLTAVLGAVMCLAQRHIKRLLLLAGVIALRLGSVSEHDLRDRDRDMPITAALTILGGLAPAGPPPFATALGKAITEDAATATGAGWLVAVFVTPDTSATTSPGSWSAWSPSARPSASPPDNARPSARTRVGQWASLNGGRAASAPRSLPSRIRRPGGASGPRPRSPPARSVGR